MINSVDVDKYGAHGILFNSDVTIFNLGRDKGRVVSCFEGGGEYVGTSNRTTMSGKASLGDNSRLNAVFMGEIDECSFDGLNIAKFGVHPRICDNFICTRGGTVLYGHIEGIGIEYISNQMVNITSFDWSPHFSTGTFVTSSEDALIRISDLRTKDIDYSFLSFYNTTHVKWSSLNSCMIATLHENCNFMSIYDLRTLRSIGIIPKTAWNNDNTYTKNDTNIIDFEWLPFTSNKIIINQIEFLSVIDISSSLGNFKMVENCLSNNLCQTISFVESDSKLPYTYYKNNNMNDISDCGKKTTDEKLNSENFKRDKIRINTFNFIPETTSLMAHNEFNNELYYCDLKDITTGNSDNNRFKFEKTDIKVPNNTFKIFVRENNLLAFTGHNRELQYNDELESDTSQVDLWFKTNIKFPKQDSAKRQFFNLKNILLEWFVKDVNFIHDKIKNNYVITNNISHIIIESNEKIIMKISRHLISQGKFVFEDNTHIPGLIDDINSFEFSISLNISRVKNSFVTVKYYITENTVQLINMLAHTISIYSCNSVSDIFPQEDMHACMNVIPMRIFIDGTFFEKKELGYLYGFFEIKINEEKLSASSDCLLDWTAIFSNWPDILTIDDSCVDEDISERFEDIIWKVDNNTNVGDLDFLSVKSKLIDSYFHSGSVTINDSPKLSTKFSFVFKNVDRMFIVKDKKLFFLRLSDNKLKKGGNDIVKNLIYEIDQVLTGQIGMDCRMSSVLKSKDDSYFGCAYILFNWLTKAIYNENKNRQVINIQTHCLDISNSEKNQSKKGFCLDEKLIFHKNNNILNGKFVKKKTISSELLLLGPTLIHSLLNDKFISLVNRNRDIHSKVTKSYSDSENNSIIYSDTLFKNNKIDKQYLISILKKLYLEIENNYNSRIMVVSIKKLLSYLKNYKKCDFSASNTEYAINEFEVNKCNKKQHNPQSNGSFLICYVCYQYVYGLYTSCSICKHGGHIKHIKNWFETMGSHCPMPNCNCRCNGTL
ncbi:hypothetical protein FG379_000809 [Cryptosporidium bovis]|uniref:uncharacterized protein n=1 Tax=Cryptosporidium bovis TaxID=310047 RepID=UPI00351AA0BF|nr:hypothetical protein FG379_000809 [Cryptosporidium bovis]